MLCTRRQGGSRKLEARPVILATQRVEARELLQSWNSTIAYLRETDKRTARREMARVVADGRLIV